MSEIDLIIAGFGGQGILLLGEILARAAVLDGKNVTWMPTYGPEQRGGTATCTVVIADHAIGSPVVFDPRIVIAMNRPSLDKFEPRVQPHGLLIVNTSTVNRSAARTDLRIVEVDAAAEAAHLGVPQVANMVLLGALLAAESVVSEASVERALAERFRSREEIAEVNLKAVARGRAIARAQLGLAA